MTPQPTILPCDAIARTYTINEKTAGWIYIKFGIVVMPSEANPNTYFLLTSSYNP
jgi:hypothetical protein